MYRPSGNDEAYRIGLVNKVIPQNNLLEEVTALATKIAAIAPNAVQLTKSAVNRGMDMDLRSGIAYEAEAFGVSFATDDQTEGMKAFLEKRKAEFKGK